MHEEQDTWTRKQSWWHNHVWLRQVCKKHSIVGMCTVSWTCKACSLHADRTKLIWFKSLDQVGILYFIIWSWSLHHVRHDKTQHMSPVRLRDQYVWNGSSLYGIEGWSVWSCVAQTRKVFIFSFFSLGLQRSLCAVRAGPVGAKCKVYPTTG